jgi:hypothetical protein
LYSETSNLFDKISLCSIQQQEGIMTVILILME